LLGGGVGGFFIVFFIVVLAFFIIIASITSFIILRWLLLRFGLGLLLLEGRLGSRFRWELGRGRLLPRRRRSLLLLRLSTLMCLSCLGSPPSSGGVKSFLSFESRIFTFG